MGITQEQVLEALSKVNDPDLHKSIVSLGMVHDIAICDGNVGFEIRLTTTACPMKGKIQEDARQAVAAIPGVKSVDARISGKTISLGGVPEKQSIPGVKNIIAVSSGKGGVGKSTVAVNLAAAIAQRGATVGILDADVYGPNVPLMMGLGKEPFDWQVAEDGRPMPPEKHGLKVLSIAFMIPKGQSMTVRGPIIHKSLQGMLFQFHWGELDYLIVDMPPGTGDVQLSLAQLAPISGAVMVTTPQEVSVADTERGINMWRQQGVNVPVLGLVENMSYFVNRHGEREDIFGHGGGQAMAETLNVPFLGQVPLVTRVRENADAGVPIVVAEPENPAAQVLQQVADAVVARVCDLGIAAMCEQSPQAVACATA